MIPSTQSTGPVRLDRSTTTRASVANQPPSTSVASSPVISSSDTAYGGSAKTTSYGPPSGPPASTVATLPVTNRADGVTRRVATFSRITRAARGRTRPAARAWPPGERLQPDRSGTGVQIGEAGTVEIDLGLDGAEERLADPVGGGSGAGTGWRGDPSAAERPGHDPGHHLLLLMPATLREPPEETADQVGTGTAIT
ncbi:hypothetical protein GCM10027614_65460 [Micromonospora vulcania]